MTTSTLAAIAREMQEEAWERRGWLLPGLVSRRLLGWTVLLSARHRPFSSRVRWHLSMQLWPVGRGSTENDWFNQGRLAAALGAPPDSAMGLREDGTFATHPNAPHHWSWPATAPPSL